MNAGVKTKSFMDGSLLINRDQKKKANTFTDRLNTMVLNAVKNDQKSNGVSFDAVCKYLEDTYHLNMKTQKLKPFINKALMEGVHNGVFDKMRESYFLVSGRKRKLIVEDRFRIKEKEIIETESQNVLLKDEIETEAKRVNYDSAPSNVKLDGIKEATSPPTCGMIIMILNCMKGLNKRNGVSFDEIRKYMEEKYRVDMKVLGSYAKNTFKECIDYGIFERTYRAANEEERFKIKEQGSIEIEPQNVLLKHELDANVKYDFASSNVKHGGIKEVTSPPTCGMMIMILNCMKNLNKHYGASFDEISLHMEEKLQVDMKVLGSYAKNTFEECVDHGIFEKTSRSASMVERFRIKEEENREREPQNVLLKDEKVKKLTNGSTSSTVKLEVKADSCPPTRQMLIMIFKNSLKNLNKHNGVPFSEISKYMEENYQIDMKAFCSYVQNVLEECVDNGLLEKINSEASKEEIFRIKESGNIAKVTENLLVKGVEMKTRK